MAAASEIMDHGCTSHLSAAEAAIRAAGKPLSSHELVRDIRRLGIAEISGATPHKTINARLSEDISRKGEMSIFMRTAQGRFSLREFAWEPEKIVKARTIAPLEEDIKVIPTHGLQRFLKETKGTSLYQLNRTELVRQSITVLRSKAEERTDIVQLIPSFVVKRGGSVLSFNRTKRLPEARLHYTKSINFGGHLQADDFPVLFSDVQSVVDLFLMRELHEELELSAKPTVTFLGGLYLENSRFERQHLGLVYLIDLPEGADARSVEPGYHTNLRFEMIRDLLPNAHEVDSWSKVLLEEVSTIYGN